MFTLLLLFALNVVTPTEMACVGSIQSTVIPREVYIAGVEQEGTLTLASTGQIIYLNGPGVSTLKPGTVHQVIRPEGRIKNPTNGEKLGTYYKHIGTVRVDTIAAESATAQVLLSCQAMAKGDVVIPYADGQNVSFSGDLSNERTQVPQNGLVGSIVLGMNDLRELASGHYCFIGLGQRDGVKVGDQFTVFRPYPRFNRRDMSTLGGAANRSYSSARDYSYQYTLNSLLGNRKLPPQILGDVVVIKTENGVSTAKIVNSLSEIHPGDLVVKR
jgi:hypothetical protein